MDTGTVVSACSAFIALAALSVAILEARTTRRHHRLSVTPHLTITYAYSNCNPRFVAEIENTGLGPAVITRFDVFLDKEHQAFFESGSWLAILDLLGLKGHSAGLNITPGEFIAVGRKCLLIRYDGADEKEGMREIRQALQKICVEIDYESIYGRRFRETFSVPPSIFDCIDTGSHDL